MRLAVSIMVCVLAFDVRIVGQAGQKPAVAEQAVSAIARLFDDYQLVGLGEGPHNNEAGHAFRMALLRDVAFADRVNDIVVEFGNARYQALLDRFVIGDESIPISQLRDLWQDTAVPSTIWDKPMYYDFLAAVREVNKNRPLPRKIRVLLGDPPIDWSTIKTADDINRNYPLRGPHAAEVIRREILAKNRRALIVYGDGHFEGRDIKGLRSLLTVVESDPKVRMFTISNSFVDLPKMLAIASTWSVPSLIRVRDTELGSRPYGEFYPVGDDPKWKGVTLQQQFDAVLWLGGQAKVSFAELPKSLCNDSEYMEMRLHRYALTATTRNPDPASGLKKFCGVKP